MSWAGLENLGRNICNVVDGILIDFSEVNKLDTVSHIGSCF